VIVLKGRHRGQGRVERKNSLVSLRAELFLVKAKQAAPAGIHGRMAENVRHGITSGLRAGNEEKEERATRA
jgi:hypothetical protein